MQDPYKPSEEEAAPFSGGDLTSGIVFKVVGTEEPHIKADTDFGPLTLGKAGAATYLTDDTDVLVGDGLEVIGPGAFLDVVSIYDTLKIRSCNLLTFGNAGWAAATWCAEQSQPTLMLGLGDTPLSVILTSKRHMHKDHGIPAQDFPSLIGFSDSDPTENIDEYWIINHQQDFAYFSTPTGWIQLGGTVGGGYPFPLDDGEIYVKPKLTVGGDLQLGANIVGKVATDLNIQPGSGILDLVGRFTIHDTALEPDITKDISAERPLTLGKSGDTGYGLGIDSVLIPGSLEVQDEAYFTDDVIMKETLSVTEIITGMDDLYLNPGGLVKFGRYFDDSGATITGYIEILDQDDNPRLLAVVEESGP